MNENEMLAALLQKLSGTRVGQMARQIIETPPDEGNQLTAAEMLNRSHEPPTEGDGAE